MDFHCDLGTSKHIISALQPLFPEQIRDSDSRGNDTPQLPGYKTNNKENTRNEGKKLDTVGVKNLAPCLLSMPRKSP